jgi:diaminohydroxyphosphoribosylaminopyrimidine deaminase / 5-amino-6-(5-phosphoribosylamino)uracil reductase
MNDFRYMNKAFELALKARGKTSPNPMVGALIVKNGKIVGQGYHQVCGRDHAEIIALKQAGDRSKGATLYVTLEPCSHTGRTPPCVDRIINSGIKRVVAGTKDPNPENNGKSFLKLKKHGIKVDVGILQGELSRINEAFFKFIRYKMPFVVVKCAQTLDGKVATAKRHSKWITSLASRRYAHHLRKDFDAILVGINTVIEDDPFLDAGRGKKKIKKIILDSTLRMPLKGNIYKNANSQDIFIATTQKSETRKARKLINKGVRIVTCPCDEGRLDLNFLFKFLAEQEIISILIEGGPQVIGSALKQGLVDKMWFFIAPKVFGDQQALSVIQGLNIKKIDHALQLKDLSIRCLGEEVLIEGYMNKRRKR